jgi:putative oxygen-independent coproporphyrinogen III oxidase
MPILPKFYADAIPLSLYIHLPWCVHKCPYCDFNSHEAKGDLPQEIYVAALLQELSMHLPRINDRRISSIFFGGGTPSLFSPQMIARILDGVAKLTHLEAQCEITLEANPGTIDQHSFAGFYQAGVNRLSIGIQSFQNDKLKILGRIHDSAQAMRAIDIARKAGFDNFNLDIMYGLPNQTLDDALFDVETALSFAPMHFSWYQLTIEPNTLFHYQTPVLPHDEKIWDMQLAGQLIIKNAGFHQYEVSAYAKQNRECYHNRNYWQFGDYLGIGAGAHSKMTDLQTGELVRFAQVKNPRDYLDRNKREQIHYKLVLEREAIFEFMLNALRLTSGVPLQLFAARTGIALEKIAPLLADAKNRGLLLEDNERLCASELGHKFLNDLTEMFL